MSNATKTGKVPKWSIIRQRYWKNKAMHHKNGMISELQVYESSPENIARMEKGLSPKIENVRTRQMERVELHHNPAMRNGGKYEFIECSPEGHAKLDDYRKLGGK